MPKIPSPLIAVVAECMEKNYTHSQIDNRFFTAGFENDPPFGNKIQKVQTWLRYANENHNDPLASLGKLIEEIMDIVSAEQNSYVSALRERITRQLVVHGLSYVVGGHITRTGVAATGKTLSQMLAERNLIGVQQEFERIISNLDSDPPAAVTAACSLLESLFKSYIADESLTLPAEQSVLPLWKVIRTHLGLNPGDFADDNLKRILSGMASTVDGIAGLRSGAGSAHGHDARAEKIKGFRVAPRHARLAAHAAMALAVFFIETIEARNAISAS
jgi:hypothetical protein